MYLSTRGKERVSASEAIIKGLASDGGLFVPERLGKLELGNEYLKKSYPEIAVEVFKLFLDDFTEAEIIEAVEKSYNGVNFAEKFACVKSFDGFSFLELYHGPTAAFKDMALTVLPNLMKIAKRKTGTDKKTLVLVATSGDTGGAALSSFKASGGFDTVVLYPDGGVSEIQEKQMLYYTDERTKAYAMKGNFDDCQTFVKEVFSSYTKGDEVMLSSANSINIGRLIPQVVYYVYAYLELVKSGKIKMGDVVDAYVPTGNFGDIFACYLAKLIGVKYGKLVCASNKNNVLTDFFASGVYDKNRPFYKSNSPAMDILVSSNLERLLYYVSNKKTDEVKGYMEELKLNGKYKVSDELFKNLSSFGYSYTDEYTTLTSIKSAFDELDYLIDPHTAVAYDSYKKGVKSGNHALIVSTASPFKFPTTICEALGINGLISEGEMIERISLECKVKIPSSISKLLSSNVKKRVVTKEDVLDRVYYRNRKVSVIAPASSANLGCGFDSAGISLGIFNEFKFEESEVDDVSAFTCTPENNLLLISYKKLFEKYDKKYVPVKITPVKCDVPTSRGLGSSATCIVSGVLAANYMLGGMFTDKQLLSVMTELEGHPDNVAPCFLGGFIASYKKGEEVISCLYGVSEKLKFTAIIPSIQLSTRVAREALPKSVEMSEIVHVLSRGLNMARAFESGNLEMIKDVFDDKLHAPYRLNLIDEADIVKAELERQGFAVTVSGAGSTLLAVGYKSAVGALKGLNLKNGWKTVTANPITTRAEVKS